MSVLIIKYLLAVLFILNLISCGGDETSNINNNNKNSANTGNTNTQSFPGFTETKIASFTAGYVNGQSGLKAIEVDPAINDGEFTLNWGIQSSGLLRMDLYVSKDDVFSEDDEYFYGDNCYNIDGDPNKFDCSAAECKFESNNRIRCSDDPYINNGVNLTDYFDSLPEQNYIIMKICETSAACYSSISITFN